MSNREDKPLSREVSTSAPAWFLENIESPFDDEYLDVEGARIHYQRWPGNTDGPKAGLILVHGNGAHARWWDFIAPSFRHRFDVVALDLSGAGDSAHREKYTPSLFAHEIMAVAEHAGLEYPVIAGHSFGGSMARVAGWLHGDSLSGIVLVDSMISSTRGKRRPPRSPRSEVRYFESMEEAVRRFRLRPPQPCQNQYILDYIARHSIRETPQGYTFKLDQSLFSRMAEDDQYDFPDGITMLREISCKVALIYGERSRFFNADQIASARQLFDDQLIDSIAGAHHHVFLDEPLAFMDSLARMLDKLYTAS